MNDFKMVVQHLRTHFRRRKGRLPDKGRYQNQLYDIPYYFLLDTGNLCNLRCPYCPTGALQKGIKRGMMSLENFGIVLEKISPYARFLELMNWGEPFLNKNLLRMIRMAADKGICVNFDSNLTLHDFTEEECEAIIRSGVYFIKASIDGVSQETYEQYRKTGDFKRAIANLALLQKTKKRLKSRTPLISWQYLVHAGNEHEIERAKEIAKDLELSIHFRPIAIFGKELKFSKLHDLIHSGKFNPDDWDFHYGDSTKNSRGRQWVDRNLRRDVLAALPDGVPQECQQPFNRVVINFDGKMVPCCNCYGDHFALGDLTKERLEDIWNGEAMRANREFLLNYGEKQNTKSVCEMHYCPPLPKKFKKSSATSQSFSDKPAE